MDTLAFQKLDEFFSQYKKLSFKKGETIFRAGEEPRGVFFLEKGYTRLYSVSNEGEELTLIIYKPGEIFPLRAAFQPERSYPYFLEAFTKAQLISVPISSFIRFFKENPDILLEVSIELMKRLDRILRRLEYAVFGNAHQKIASIILVLNEAFGKEVGREFIIQVPLTHKGIANIVGITRETASIEIKKLERKDIVVYSRRHLVIKNMEKLKEESLFI